MMILPGNNFMSLLKLDSEWYTCYLNIHYMIYVDLIGCHRINLKKKIGGVTGRVETSLAEECTVDC